MHLKGPNLPLSALLVTLGLAIAVLWLMVRLTQAGQTRAAARAGYFSAVAGMFTAVVVRVEPSGFARMSGVWNGVRFDLQAVPDTLTFRKLPALWVLVTLTEPVAIATELHIMARPGQSDVFSTFDKMPASVALPDGFPEFCALRCLNASGLPDQAVMMDQAPLFAGGLVKELVISPKGLRLVILAEEADRGAYLLFREAEMGRQPLAPARLLPLLQALLKLHTDLDSGQERAHD